VNTGLYERMKRVSLVQKKVHRRDVRAINICVLYLVRNLLAKRTSTSYSTGNDPNGIR
jgi:hypothetical protein